MRKFEVHAEITDALIRLSSGNSLPEDRRLLGHEPAALTCLRDNPGATYQAHRVAIGAHQSPSERTIGTIPYHRRAGRHLGGEW